MTLISRLKSTLISKNGSGSFWKQPWFQGNSWNLTLISSQPWNQGRFQNDSFCTFSKQSWFKENFLLNNSLVASSGCRFSLWRVSNSNVVSSRKEVEVCRSVADPPPPLGACLDLFFCKNSVFVNEKSMTTDSSGLLGRPGSTSLPLSGWPLQALGLLRNSEALLWRIHVLVHPSYSGEQ